MESTDACKVNLVHGLLNANYAFLLLELVFFANNIISASLSFYWNWFVC